MVQPVLQPEVRSRVITGKLFERAKRIRFSLDSGHGADIPACRKPPTWLRLRRIHRRIRNEALRVRHSDLERRFLVKDVQWARFDEVCVSIDLSPHYFWLAVDVALFNSLRKTCPPFMTNFTCSSSVISLAGLPETATKSANLPFSIDPTRSRQPMLSAPTEVAERIACRGVIPYSTMVANSTASSP